MRIRNNTVFQTTTFLHWNAKDEEMATVIVKGMLFRQGEGWAYLITQPEIRADDNYAGDVASSYLLNEQDIAPFKPATDLLIVADACAPAGDPLEEWPVEVSIPGRLSYGFHVRGPSQWEKNMWGEWTLSPPQKVTDVPIDYSRAFGGSALDGEQLIAFEHNPAGCGVYSENDLNELDTLPAPQLGLLAEFSAVKVNDPMTVCGFGPIAKTWLPRRGLAGTFDDIWRKTRHPRMPKDYDFRYWNCAPGPLQLSPFLRGGETISFRHLSAISDDYSVVLPNTKIVGTLSPDGVRVPFNLDSVSVNIRGESAESHSVELIWRARIPVDESMTTFEVNMVDGNGKVIPMESPNE